MGDFRLASLFLVFGACAFQHGEPMQDPGGGGGSGSSSGGGGTPHSGITFDSRSGTMVTGGSVLSWDHTVGNTVTDGLLLVGASIEKQSGAEVSSITYAGQPLTRVQFAVGGEGVRTELWYLTAPPLGTATVEMTLSTDLMQDGAVGGGVSLAGVDPQTPIPTFAIGEASSGSPSTTITVQNDNAWVVDSTVIDTGDHPAAVTGSQLQRWNLAAGLSGLGSTIDGTTAGPHTMSWSGPSDNWAQVVAEIKPR